MERILVATDGSEHARRAAVFAVQLAKAAHARVTVAHVILPLYLPADVMVFPEYIELTDKAHRSAGRGILRAAASEVEQQLGQAPDVLLLEGDPANELAEAVKTSGSDLLVVGSRGLGVFSRILLGSTSSKLTHVCEKPVLVVP